MENLSTEDSKLCDENSSKSIKTRKTQDWEIEMIGEFLLKLFHQNTITIYNSFMILKHILREEFKKFLELSENTQFKVKFQEQNGTASDLGSLLYRTNFLLNTPRGSKYYQVRSITLFQYSNKKLKNWDEQRLNCDNFVISSKNLHQNSNESNAKSLDCEDKYDPELLDCFKPADDAKSYSLEYQGSSFERRPDDFSLSSMGCFICLQNFTSPEEFEEHVQWHGEDSDFESLKKMKKLEKAFFTLAYSVCKDSHYFCFSLSTNEEHVIIEKIIIVRTRSMFYVNNNRVPYAVDESGVDQFFVDSHLFNVSVEQPVVIVFRYKSNEAMRIVEQHHFMRAEEFPEVNFSIKANRLPNRTMFKPKLSLLQYLPSNEIKQALKHKFSNETLENISNEFGKYLENKKITTADTMIGVWNLLLQIEDMDVMKNFECLVQRNVQFRSFGNEYSLQLKVKRHIYVDNILSQYDEVLIIPENNEVKCTEFDYFEACIDYDNKKKKKKNYYGIVERISNNRVVILCNQKLPEKVLYKVIFRPARLTLRYQYRALQLLSGVPCKLIQRYFFPDIKQQTEQIPIQFNLNLFNSSIADNCEQLEAVQNIANGPSKSATYIIFGPPGTGKTTTLVEAILQLYKNRPETKILVTAGSNSACDEIALRLCKTLMSTDDPRAMVRIFAKSNEKRQDSIDEELLEASNMYGAHFYPDITILHEYRIVICTLSVVGRLATGNFGKTGNGQGVFTHTFVDEVAASTATEVLVGIASTISPINHLIISGDHKQLGPILQSKRASELGLDLSLMERLLAQDCYRIDELGIYNRSIQTRLRRNHRSHRVIVDCYSELYYENQLIPLAKQDVDLASKWHYSPNPTYPIIFHSVFGQSMRGKSDVSMYNDKELEVVLDYVKDLMCFGINGEKVKESDIGIISPYRKQYLRIQEELNSRRLFGIETGSVEIFQGKEKAIIIVSFVRSFTDKLGFLDNPRRLNVTLSRAKSLLILIGNPKTLSISPDFKHIIDRCKNNNSIVGATLYEDSPSSVLLDKSETTDKSNTVNAKKIPSKEPNQRRKKKSRGNNKNKIAKTPKENKQKNGSNEEPKLGKQMKKCVSSVSQKKYRENLDKFQKMVENDTYIFNEKKPNNIDVEEVFSSLPKTPFQSQQAENISFAGKNDDLGNMEREIHEKMRKLRLRVPKATNFTSTDFSLKSTESFPQPSIKRDSNIISACNSKVLPSKNKIEDPRYSAHANLTNLPNLPRISSTNENTANVGPGLFTLKMESEAVRYAPLNSFKASAITEASVTNLKKPTNVSQTGSSKLPPSGQAQYDRHDYHFNNNRYEMNSDRFAHSAKLQQNKKSSCIIA